MEKVKVSREVAKAIEDTRSNGFSDESIISAHAIMPKNWSLEENKALNEMSLDTLIRALYFGYEVEQTPEEIIKEKYDELFDYEPIDRACKDSFRFVLDTLGIKIKGVND